ncbi:hypothetical protein EYR40_002038 [Pleurotus pulmonarius]|nr:hypothetical protein EYR40_002038 [Pleurotus pulmonarius]
MALGPTHFDFWDQELFIFAYSNMTKGTLAAAKSPQAVEVLEAIRITLNLPDNTGLGTVQTFRTSTDMFTIMTNERETRVIDMTPLPATLSVHDTPPLWKSPTPQGYPTPPCYLGFRLTTEQLGRLLDPESGKPWITVASLRTRHIWPRWYELGYDEQFKSIAPPGVTLGPNHTGPWDQEVIIFAFSNMSRKAIATSQGPEAAGILAALQHALNLPDEAGLGWHTYSPRILKGVVVAASRPVD